MASREESVYLTSTEAGRILGVSAKTVDRWADAGRIGCLVTLGKHRRFHRDEVLRVANMMGAPAVPPSS
jgi:excisionase family DNA binding protein